MVTSCLSCFHLSRSVVHYMQTLRYSTNTCMYSVWWLISDIPHCRSLVHESATGLQNGRESDRNVFLFIFVALSLTCPRHNWRGSDSATKWAWERLRRRSIDRFSPCCTVVSDRAIVRNVRYQQPQFCISLREINHPSSINICDFLWVNYKNILNFSHLG